MKVLVCIFIVMFSMCVTAFAEPTLNLGPATANGTTVSFPVILTNVPGTSISGIEADIIFNNTSDAFALKMAGNAPVSAIAGAAALAAGKDVSHSVNSGALHILVIGLNANPIPDGIVAQVSFDIVTAATSNNESFGIVPYASSPDYQEVYITGSGTPAPDTRQLAVIINGNGGGSIKSAPPGIVCSGTSCSANFYAGSSATIIPAATVGSSFGSWYGDCTGKSNCSVTMNNNRSATATFTLNDTTLVGGKNDNSLNAAYGAAADKSVIQARGVTFFEDLALNRDIVVTIKGGYDLIFQNQVGYTTVNGRVTVSKGLLVADHVTIW